MVFKSHRKLAFLVIVIAALFLSGCVEKTSVKTTKICKEPDLIRDLCIYGDWIAWIRMDKGIHSVEVYNLKNKERTTISSDEYLSPLSIYEGILTYWSKEGTHIYNLSAKKEEALLPDVRLSAMYKDKGCSIEGAGYKPGTIERISPIEKLTLWNLTTMEKKTLWEDFSITGVSFYGDWIVWINWNEDPESNFDTYAYNIKEDMPHLLIENSSSNSLSLYKDRIVYEYYGNLWIYNLTTKEDQLFKEGYFIDPKIYGDLIAAVEIKKDGMEVLKVWDIDTKKELFSCPFAVGILSIYENKIIWAGMDVEDEETVESLRAWANISTGDIVKDVELREDFPIPQTIFMVEIDS